MMLVFRQEEVPPQATGGAADAHDAGLQAGGCCPSGQGRYIAGRRRGG